MARDWYFAPAGLGTSGSGASRSNPIYGLSNIASVGITNGDRLIFTGQHKEQLIIPQNNLTIIGDNAVFDGSFSLNGSYRLSSTTFASETGSNWQLVDAGLNVWKKGSNHGGMLFVNDEWIEPMPTSLSTNSAATILANIQEYEWTARTETLDGSTRAIYIRLPSGTTPSNVDIKLSGRITYVTGVTAGFIQASQKSGLVFDGNFLIKNTNQLSSLLFNVWLDRCVNTEIKKDAITSKYSAWGLRTTAGDNLTLIASGDHLLNAAIAIDAADETTGITYTGGDITVTDWNATYCGWMPRYNGIDINYNNDADGGVAIGFRGGTLANITVQNGYSYMGGPSVAVKKTGWLGDLNRGSGVYFGTADTMTISGNVSIKRNIIDSSHRFAINVTGTGLRYEGKIECSDNLIKNNRAPNIATNAQAGIINIRPNVSGAPAINIDICNNSIFNSKHSISAFNIGHVTALGSNFNIHNNTITGCSLETGYSTNYGTFRIIDAITGARSFKNNISDLADSGPYARITATSYASAILFNASGIAEVSGNLQGTVTEGVDKLIAGTADPIGTAVKYWANGQRPTALNGEPRPDAYGDIGCYQSTSHEFHPNSLLTSI